MEKFVCTQETATARAAATAGTIMVWKITCICDIFSIPNNNPYLDAIYHLCILRALSSWATYSVEEVNYVGTGIHFF
jgi:hypothetical protein